MFDSKSPFYVAATIKPRTPFMGTAILQDTLQRQHVEKVDAGFARSYLIMSKELYPGLFRKQANFQYQEEGLLNVIPFRLCWSGGNPCW